MVKIRAEEHSIEWPLKSWLPPPVFLLLLLSFSAAQSFSSVLTTPVGRPAKCRPGGGACSLRDVACWGFVLRTGGGQRPGPGGRDGSGSFKPASPAGHGGASDIRHVAECHKT